MKVYLLQHMYAYGDELQHEEIKLIGVYSTQGKAEETVKIYQKLPGFKDHEAECFYIDEFEVDKDCWREGFCSWDDASQTEI